MSEREADVRAAGPNSGLDASSLGPQEPGQGIVRVFMNSTGLRAGWRAVLYVLLFAACMAVLFTPVVVLTHGKRVHGDMPPGVALLGEGLQLLAIFAAAAILGRIEHRRLLAVPFAGKAKLLRLVTGAVWGFVALSALVFTLWKLHLLAFGQVSLNGGPALGYGLLWAVMFLMVGLAEEALMRGYLQSILARGMGFWPAAVLISALFGAMHLNNKGESHVGILSAALVGLLFSLSLWYTGSLWWAIGFHAAWDWGQSFFYGTADSGMMVRGHLLAEHPMGNTWWSGGATGPEGSPYILLLLVVAAAACWAWWGRRAPVWPAVHGNPIVMEDHEPAFMERA